MFLANALPLPCWCRRCWRTWASRGGGPVRPGVITTSLSSIFVGVVANIPVALRVRASGARSRTWSGTSGRRRPSSQERRAASRAARVGPSSSARPSTCTPGRSTARRRVRRGQNGEDARRGLIRVYLALETRLVRKLGIVLPRRGDALVAGPISSTSIVGVCGVLLMVHMMLAHRAGSSCSPSSPSRCVAGRGSRTWPEVIVGEAHRWRGRCSRSKASASVARRGRPRVYVIISLFDIATASRTASARGGRVDGASGACAGRVLGLRRGHGLWVSAQRYALLLDPTSASSSAPACRGGHQSKRAYRPDRDDDGLLLPPDAPVLSNILVDPALFASSGVLVVLGAQLLGSCPRGLGTPCRILARPFSGFVTRT